MFTDQSNLCFGLVLLLEAAEYQNQANMATPSVQKRDLEEPGASPSLVPPSRPKKPVYSKPVSFSSSPPKKRIKLDGNLNNCVKILVVICNSLVLRFRDRRKNSHKKQLY